MKRPSHLILKKRLLLLALVAGMTPALQGCFPIVAGGATAAAMMASDRRTSGAYLEDEGIEWKTRQSLDERFGSSVNIGVTSFNRNVLLTGQAPNAAARNEATKIAAGIENVRGTINQLSIGGLSQLGTKSNDTLITTNVRARLLKKGAKNSHLIKVVTESNVVYLMGIVTRQEADQATEITRNTKGVEKVVRVFEYIEPAEAQRLDGLPRQENLEK